MPQGPGSLQGLGDGGAVGSCPWTRLCAPARPCDTVYSGQGTCPFPVLTPWGRAEAHSRCFGTKPSGMPFLSARSCCPARVGTPKSSLLIRRPCSQAPGHRCPLLRGQEGGVRGVGTHPCSLLLQRAPPRLQACAHAGTSPSVPSRTSAGLPQPPVLQARLRCPGLAQGPCTPVTWAWGAPCREALFPVPQSPSARQGTLNGPGRRGGGGIRPVSPGNRGQPPAPTSSICVNRPSHLLPQCRNSPFPERPSPSHGRPRTPSPRPDGTPGTRRKLRPGGPDAGSGQLGFLREGGRRPPSGLIVTQGRMEPRGQPDPPRLGAHSRLWEAGCSPGPGSTAAGLRSTGPSPRTSVKAPAAAGSGKPWDPRGRVLHSLFSRHQTLPRFLLVKIQPPRCWPFCFSHSNVLAQWGLRLCLSPSSVGKLTTAQPRQLLALRACMSPGTGSVLGGLSTPSCPKQAWRVHL